MSKNARSSSSKKLKELNVATKEKKDYFLKVQLMNNRLKNLKQKKNEVNVKILSMKNKEKHREDFQNFKEKNLMELKEMKCNSQKYLNLKKQIVQKEKKMRSESMQRSMLLKQEKKQKQFSDIKADKIFTEQMLTQYNNHKYNLNKCKVVNEKLNKVKNKTLKERNRAFTHEKIKRDYQVKINKEKKETSKLKLQLERLEKCEEQYLYQLNQSMICQNEMKKNLKKKIFDWNDGKNKNKTIGQSSLQKNVLYLGRGKSIKNIRDKKNKMSFSMEQI